MNRTNNNNLTNENNDNENNGNNINETNYFNSIIRNSLEYYDQYQPKIQDILNKIEYIKINLGTNINDEYTFYDSNDKPFLKSRIDQLGIFIPQDNYWKWSWSDPFSKNQNTLISRKILEYSFTLNSTSDLYLKSILLNSKLKIMNQYQIDIYVAIAAMLSKKPFILKFYLHPSLDKNEKIYYRKMINDPERNKFISIYIIIIDWNNES